MLKQANFSALFAWPKIKIIVLFAAAYKQFQQSSVPDWDTIWRYKSSLTQVTWADTNFGRATLKLLNSPCVEVPVNQNGAK
jgi:hypothetical protein